MHEVKRVLGAMAVVAVLMGGTAGLVAAQGEWKAPGDAKKVKNPLADKKKDAKVLADGKKLADVNCASCHGPKGMGDGPAAAALNPKPANWTSDKVSKETDGELFWKISNGRGAMPPWKHLPEKDRWTLINYIRSLHK